MPFIEGTSNSVAISFRSDSFNNDRGFHLSWEGAYELLKYYSFLTNIIEQLLVILRVCNIILVVELNCTTRGFKCVVNSNDCKTSYFRPELECEAGAVCCASHGTSNELYLFVLNQPFSNESPIQVMKFLILSIVLWPIVNPGSIRKIFSHSSFLVCGTFRSARTCHIKTHGPIPAHILNFLILSADLQWVYYYVCYIGCGGVFSGKDHGYFASPGYPDMYDNNQYCWYEVIVPQGLIQTHIEFDIEHSAACMKDHVIVSERQFYL